MKLFLILSIGTCWIVSGIVSLKLFVLAARTRQAPELLIGLSLFIGTVVGFMTIQAAQAFAADDLILAERLYGAGIIALGLGTLAALLAWWRIYHPADRWAAVLVVLWTLTGSMTVAKIAANPPPGMDQGAPYGDLRVAIAYFIAHGGVFVLMSFSGLRYYGPLRRRVDLGLADPIVANRILSWSIAAAGAAGQYLVAFAVRQFELGRAGVLLGNALIGCLGIVVSLTLVAAFFPPKPYLDWLQRNAGRMEL